MELLLNLAWLLLALPAFFLWRGARRRRCARGSRSLQCLLALGCMLVILFPVVSATDDLHAVSTEMEESTIGKRVHTAADRHSSARSPVLPALVVASFSVIAADSSRLSLSIPPISLPTAPAVRQSARAPPVTLLG